MLAHSFMRMWYFALIVNVGLATGAVAATPEQVDAAIKKGVSYLLSVQKDDNWEGGTGKATQEGGLTACAIYALLAAGETPQNNPKLAAAIEWLKKQDVQGTYALGMRCQVWKMLPNAKDPAIRSLIKRDAQTLLAGTSGKGGTGLRGNWHYTPDQKTFDNSCSQYGVLGLWALERSGFEVGDKVWQSIEQHWKTTQRSDGGWGYDQVAKTDLPMTAAGVASLFITQDYLHGMDGIRCNGNPTNPVIAKGMKWLAEGLGKEQKLSPYTWYGIERIGVASGYKYIGTIDWYRAGADALIKMQGKDGDWVNATGFAVKENNKLVISPGARVAGTTFGLLFLTRGRAPVVMNKLQYHVGGKEGNWNQRPRDVANAVKFMMHAMERDLNWQIVNLTVNVDELHDAPILYVSGNQALRFSDADEAKLKSFVQQGGLVLGHADCSDSRFARSFTELGKKLFSEYEFRDLPASHPIYTRQQFMSKSWKAKPVLKGLSNGVRELMLLMPAGDPGRAWQLSDERTRPEQFELAANVFLYAVEGRDLRVKGKTHVVKPTGTAKSSFKVARLQAGDNWDPEPGGWKRLSAVMTDVQSTSVETVPVKPGGDELAAFKVAHLTGTTKVELDLTARKAIKEFVDGGGTLLVDAAGGSTEFAESAEAALHELFGPDARQLESALSSDHRLYSAAGTKLDEVTYRQFVRGRVPAGQRTPLLRGITIKGRLAVIVSREDLSGGLVGQSVDGIAGYSPESALNLMRCMVTFGSRGEPVPAKADPTAKAK